MSEFQSKDEAGRKGLNEDDTDVEAHRLRLNEDEAGDEAGRKGLNEDDEPEVEGHAKR